MWLAVWIVLSWPAIQDDALIHLRYADHLLRAHLVSYDGSNQDYGASSLLYIHLLAILRTATRSPNLARGVSSCAHFLLFVGLTCFMCKSISRQAPLARLVGLTLLFLLVTPSSVRWLDDGMESGLILCFLAVLAVLSFRQSQHATTSTLQYLAFTVLAFLGVLLRTEMILPCGICFAILTLERLPSQRSAIVPGSRAEFGSSVKPSLAGRHPSVGLHLLYDARAASRYGYCKSYRYRPLG